MKRWYLVHCKPREDSRALEHMQRQGFECYLPRRTVERVHGGRKQLMSEALFPGYLFVQMDCDEGRWSSLRSTRGVRRIVSFGGYPLPVDDTIIVGIRARLAESVHEPYLKPGERVQITEGAFARLEAMFLATEGDQRVILLLNILQQDQLLSFPLRSVRKIAP